MQQRKQETSNLALLCASNMKSKKLGSIFCCLNRPFPVHCEAWYAGVSYDNLVNINRSVH